MSTKNIARTVIEGGRNGSYKKEVHEKQREERTETRNYLRKSLADNDNADAFVAPIRKPVYKEFADKTAVIDSFLHSRVGKNWSKVRSELFEKFDTRTTPGRHILFDHLLRDVAEEGPVDVRGFTNHYYVDAQGRLQNNDRQYRKHRVQPFDKIEVCNWLKNRCVGHIGKRHYWFEPTQHKSFKAYYGNHKLEYAALDATGKIAMVTIDYSGRKKYFWEPKVTALIERKIPFRQAKMLTDQELQYLKSLPERVRKEILAYAPTKNV